MARLSNEFLMAWSSLSGEYESEGWQTISIEPSGQLELRAGRRAPDNTEALLIGFPAEKLNRSAKLPEGQGFVVEFANFEDTNALWLALTRKVSGGVELFTDMVCNVSGALDAAVASGASVEALLKIFISRVGAWQEFMRKGALTMTPEAELGLVGELCTLMALIEAGVPAAIAAEAWVGPLDGVQDFVIGAGALEVKSTLSSVGFPARIGSLQQLDDSIRQPLFVVGQRLKQVESGFGLPEFVDAARKTVNSDHLASRLLDDRLLAGCYFDAHSDRYLRKFALIQTFVIEVNGDFPRLTIGRVPLGVTRAIYDIDLEKVVGEHSNIVAAIKKMGIV